MVTNTEEGLPLQKKYLISLVKGVEVHEIWGSSVWLRSNTTLHLLAWRFWGDCMSSLSLSFLIFELWVIIPSEKYCWGDHLSPKLNRGWTMATEGKNWCWGPRAGVVWSWCSALLPWFLALGFEFLQEPPLFLLICSIIMTFCFYGISSSTFPWYIRNSILTKYL